VRRWMFKTNDHETLMSHFMNDIVASQSTHSDLETRVEEIA
jgi:hypothetical protein